MNDIGIKFFNFATIFAFIDFCAMAEAEDYFGTLDSLPVGWGEVFYDVKVISSDEYGVTFRHQNGAAKVLYEWLPLEIEEKFKPQTAEAGDAEKAPGFKIEGESSGIPPLLVNVHTRVNLPQTGWNSAAVVNPWAGPGCRPSVPTGRGISRHMPW